MGGRYRCLSKYRAMLEKPVKIHVLFFLMPVILCAPLPAFIPEETNISNTFASVLSCPINEGVRELKALAKCGNTSKYHCLQTEDGSYVEFCNKSSTWIEKGTYALFSIDKNILVFKPCPTGTFQPYGRWSHESSSTCVQKTSACNGIGEVVCDNGNMTSDRLCRCDNTNDWGIEQFLQENPLNTTCVLPSQTNFVCVKIKKCPPGQELDPGYNCINKCQEGFYRPSGSFNCLRRGPLDDAISSNVSPTTARPRDRNNPKIVLHPFVGTTKYQITMVVPIAIAVVIFVSACSILMAKCKKNSSKEKQLQNLANEKLLERRARKRHRRKIEKRKRRQEKKDKLQVKVDKALQKMEQRQEKRRQRKFLREERRQAEKMVDAEQVMDEDQISIEM